MKFALLAAAILASPAMAAPLTVATGESWVFTLDHGDPVHARKVDSTARPARGEIKLTVRALFGTMMTITDNGGKGYTYRVELIGPDGKGVSVRTCTLPSGNQPTIENWPQKAAAIRIGDFRPARGGRCFTAQDGHA